MKKEKLREYNNPTLLREYQARIERIAVLKCKCVPIDDELFRDTLDIGKEILDRMTMYEIPEIEVRHT